MFMLKDRLNEQLIAQLKQKQKQLQEEEQKRKEEEEAKHKEEARKREKNKTFAEWLEESDLDWRKFK
ncbi:YqkE family protein [Anoxybacillus ayderensis]|uniref:YqkE family protein n=1 Tax=Anoxybacillus ayderensis TaxID=265546 RepID=UPI002E210C04|nr:YqkE family protein [Anoxybacillus ayderensis]